jgi:DNA repair protein RadC
MHMDVLMKIIPSHDRPRERLLAQSAAALSDRELLALVLRSGTRATSALDLASALLAEHGSLSVLASAGPEEIATAVGIGPAKAAGVVAAFELGRRATAQPIPVVLRGPDDVARVALQELAGLRRERVLVLVCDSANRLRRTVTVSDGSIDRSLAPVREILNAVLRHDGRAFALVHNHPSGDPEPSDADHRATSDLREAARIVGLRFLGHVVVAGENWQPVVTGGLRTPR